MEVAFYQTSQGRSPVEDFIKSLPKADQARFADVYQGVTAFGLGCPRVSFRQLRGKLWEIKFNAAGGGFRVAYVMVSGDTMVWLHAFRKTTQKTPGKELEIAERRMKEVLGL